MRAGQVLIVVAALCGCARPLPPPGGERDETPPQVIATTPEPLSVVESSNDPVVFRFDGTLSEQGVRDAIALVSPQTGEPHVERSGQELRIRIDGGWQPGYVYRVIVLPGLQDRFRNARRTPAELVFSTGPDIPGGAIGGMVLERATGRPAQEDIIVEARRVREDSLPFLTVPDSGAFFALQYLPAGAYQVRAFQDRNRNRELDDGESYAQGPLLSLNRANDTLTTVLQLVPYDTVPPRMQNARVVDSLLVRITTDDYLDPDAEIELVEAELFTLPDTTEVPGDIRVMSPMTWDSLRAAADTTAVDSTRADSARAGRAGPPGRRAQEAEPEEPLPYQEFIVIPPVPLQPDTRYLLRIVGLTNISGRSGGGGSIAFDGPPRRTPADTTAVRPDTTVVPPDTTARLRR